MANDSDNDSDNDLLNILLGNDEENEINNSKLRSPQKPTDFNFLENESNIKDKPKLNLTKDSPKKLNYLSSDEEDKDYFDKQNYSEIGQEIKQLIKKKQNDERQRNIFSDPLREKTNACFSKPKLLNTQATTNSPKPKTTGVYNDPIFGLGITKPLVSSTELLERMQGRKAVTVSNVKQHLSSGNVKDDWVIAGVLIHKSTALTSQKGSQYCIWKLSDLTMSMNTVSLFLFSNAYKTFWKTSLGTIVGILNPNTLEGKNNTDQATLSVDNAQKLMILGTSRDMGKCKSVKKNGESCNATVNIRLCAYCIYHVKQEYSKCSRRAELQSSNARGLALGNNRLGSAGSNRAMNNVQGNMQPFIEIKGKRNEKHVMKERIFLEQLKSGVTIKSTVKQESTETKPKSKLVELTQNQMKKDFQRLKKLKGWDTPNQNIIELPDKNSTTPRLSLDSLKSTSPVVPRLGIGFSNGCIDLSIPISKKKVEVAKHNALQWIRKNGGIKRTDPNQIHPSKDLKTNKRKRSDDEEEEKEEKKKPILSNRFKELLEAKSTHTELVEKSQNEEQEKYFNKLEVKEKMEEKMLTTYKVDCKAVRCGLCKYTAFSASDFCKEQRHPIKVLDAVKRFFKCSDCGNRTVSLDRIPTHSCNRCNSSSWVKTAMMDEKRTKVKTSTLSIRGDEEKFYGSVSQDIDIDLLVPE